MQSNGPSFQGEKTSDQSFRPYIASRLAKALLARSEASNDVDAVVADARVRKWLGVTGGADNGSIIHGSRLPVPSAPAWATLEVVAGGFATGALLAGGPLCEHEKALIAELHLVVAGDDRTALNLWYLSEEGMRSLGRLLESGCYDVLAPEEGALLSVAWLCQAGKNEAARRILDAVTPFFSQLRFYPSPSSQPVQMGPLMHVRTVKEMLADLRAIKPHKGVVAQKEAVEIWGPLRDQAISLFLETMVGEEPMTAFPETWFERASALSASFKAQCEVLKGGRRYRKGHDAQLFDLLVKAGESPLSVTRKERGRLKLILSGFIQKRGVPGSEAHEQFVARQASAVRSPLHADIAAEIVSRCAGLPTGGGLDDANSLLHQESRLGVLGQSRPAHPIPASIQRKVLRCVNDTAERLVAQKFVTSSEALAKILPQWTAGIGASGLADDSVRRLYTAVYRAFRARRSLLLVNFQRQVQLSELPWISELDRYRDPKVANEFLAKKVLTEVTTLALVSLPQTLLPNKFLKELSALATSANLDLPLVEELAADIFMGSFSEKFPAAAVISGELLQGSLYADYYEIDYAAIRASWGGHASLGALSRWREPVEKGHAEDFSRLCLRRAGQLPVRSGVAGNGVLIEQQQIVTTQNLAPLFNALNLAPHLAPFLIQMAKTCFTWICSLLQARPHSRHQQLVDVKNSAYAWRQMLFFLSLVPRSEVAAFIAWASLHLEAQAPVFQRRFDPAIKGLQAAFQKAPMPAEGRRLLGWTTGDHWLFST